jgi:light-harvesting complex I chlorophyll a/b binding protein 4
MKLALLSTVVVGAAAFAPPSSSRFAPSSSSSSSSSSTTTSSLGAEMSKSVPFLVKPPALDGSMVGDVGFDPVGLSDNFDLRWLRESELKHGRVSMLAVVGFVSSQFVNFPMYSGMHVDDSNAAPAAVGASAMLQIVLAAGFEEYRTNKGNVTMETMFSDPARVPGDLGFDPMGYKKSADYAKLQVNEIKNGRLAMLAIGGMIHHNFVTGEPLF